MSVLLGGIMLSWKCPDAEHGSVSHATGLISKNRAYSLASVSHAVSARRRSSMTSPGDEIKMRSGLAIFFRCAFTPFSLLSEFKANISCFGEIRPSHCVQAGGLSGVAGGVTGVPVDWTVVAVDCAVAHWVFS